MRFYSQRGNQTKIGNTNYMIDRFGCLICSWAMVTDSDPNYIARQPVFDSDAVLVNPSKLASILGTEYNTSRSVALYDPVICEVRIGTAQHFVVRYQGKIYDPYTTDGRPYQNYTILGYRNVKPKENMNGLKLYDNNGQVWAVFDNKQFYVENPKSIEGLSIIKGEPSGEILIKQKDQDARLAQLRAELQGKIDARDIQINGLNAKIEQLKDEKVTLKAQIDECKEEVETLRGLLQDESEAASTCETARDKLQKQIDEHKCVVKEMTAWELVKELFKKLFK
jgi:hypothetical protein